MLTFFVIFPLPLDIGVVFQLRIRLNLFYAQFYKETVDVIHHDGIDTLTLVFGFDRHKIQVGAVIFVESFKQMDESKGKQATTGTLKCQGKGRHDNPKGNHTILFVQNDGDKLR